ncbi:Hpt domain-containing protein [Cupriavidus alkaliphilus]|uniref:Hpt domain-containing protein n=1 Tax=Cupriavidus alkaliphilus TaxID=942866 RepID=UPI000DC25EAE|nr:Hpt domain-containing protein [Cupriavidus alkaliphilus]RAS08723.1 Hpt domain-containing protein [Cupriavidus alkaliphilus]
MHAAEAQSRPRALLLAPAGDPGWLADAARILRDLGFVVQIGVSAPVADMAADVDLVMASAAAGVPSPLQAWRARGAVCAMVLPPGAVPTAGADAGVATLPAPVTEATLLAMLASQHYVALSAREAAGIAGAIAAQTFGNPAFARELLEALVSSTRDDLAQLRRAGPDLETLRGVAHRLKASAHYIGCHALRLTAQRLEHAARDGDAATAAALAAIVAPTAARLLGLLASLASANHADNAREK